MIHKKEDWISAGFEILRDEGISKVKVEVMARKLGGTKGGFYGYFSNREVFLRAMLEYWEQRHSIEIFHYINSLTGNLSDKLHKLLYTVDDEKYDAVELSICYWAVHDTLAKKIFKRVVGARLDFLANLFLEGGFSREEAEKRANIVHHFMAGCRLIRPLLPKNGSPERHEQLNHFIKQVTASVD